MQNGPHEECGIFGVRTRFDEAAELSYHALLALQHRGQEGAGIAVLKERSILYHKNVGLVSEVFTPPVLEKLPHAHCAIGHVRYSTTGSNTRGNAQPMVKEFLRGRIAAAHNGNILNAADIRRFLCEAGCDFAATNDSEVIASLIAYEALCCGDVEEAVERAAKKLVGAFTLLVLSSDGRLFAVRDGNGFRPLCLGRQGEDVAVASESCALESTGFSFVRDITPGEMVVIEENGRVKSRLVLPGKKRGMCVFEYVYFARTDSVLDGLSVYEARLRMGAALFRECPVPADIVCGVPDSGLAAALGYARESGLPYAPAFVKNRYIGRSFIFPTQAQRDAAVRLKLSPLAASVRGKRVVLVDDSIVRGTTGAKIVASLKSAGAKEVHLRICSPPFRHACHFGTDIDDPDTLIANRLSPGETAENMGADSLGYISLKALLCCCGGQGRQFCDGCFSGRYPIERPESRKNLFEGALPQEP
ncbi:MAG: amidophosphoribosyltransferase [Provencibacterium sp.]|nr:amidophosphoribosyltransferase [Provencibacterium sp.]